jgi:hypothetical protein
LFIAFVSLNPASSSQLAPGISLPGRRSLNLIGGDSHDPAQQLPALQLRERGIEAIGNRDFGAGFTQCGEHLLLSVAQLAVVGLEFERIEASTPAGNKVWHARSDAEAFQDCCFDRPPKAAIRRMECKYPRRTTSAEVLKDGALDLRFRLLATA